MRARRTLAVAAAVGSAAGAVLLSRRASRRRDRLELYFDDGTLVTLAQGEAEADRLLARARELLLSARA
jgi:hypothetical protein